MKEGFKDVLESYGLDVSHSEFILEELEEVVKDRIEAVISDIGVEVSIAKRDGIGYTREDVLDYLRNEFLRG